ncbi:MAG: nuclear transport factor 2 family protein [Rhizobacter sp.]|nr:nuclear transport factor 2 family protein [Rhizobacter sp.]
MPLRPVRQTLLAWACSALALAAPAQSRLPPGVDGTLPAAGTATRAVAHYLDRERALADALRERRRDEAAQMLAPEFEVRSAEALDAVAAPAWLDAQLHAPRTRTGVRDLAVREFGDLALVSFLLDGAVPGTGTTTLYIVDVWQQRDDRLVVRYQSQPGHPLRAPSRPRGRE